MDHKDKNHTLISKFISFSNIKIRLTILLDISTKIKQGRITHNSKFYISDLQVSLLSTHLNEYIWGEGNKAWLYSS